MNHSKNLNFCGIQVGEKELELIRDTVHDCAGLSRTELAHTLCELLEWRRPNGSLKAHECRRFLEELEAQGFLRLPKSQSHARKAATIMPPADANRVAPSELFEAGLREVSPVTLEVVETPEDQRLWREWVGHHHYLGFKVPFGAQLRYFIRVHGPEPRRVGCLQLSSPAWRMAPRDRWIGWNEEERVRGLQRIVQNSRFLILPWVRIPHLASAALAQMARRVAADWEARYAVRPLLLETLVDSARFRGTCYRAANWIFLGTTTGRGRMDREHRRDGAAPKDIFVYPLCRGAREKLRNP
jgi:hypothetical protein